MKKIYIGLIFAGLLSGLIWVFIFQNRESYRDIPRVTLNTLNDAEAAWYANGIQDYRVLISVAFAQEKRLYEVFVRRGELTEAFSAEWNEEAGTWGSFTESTGEDAAFFTIPGLFSALRTALFNEAIQREVIRMEINEADRYPSRIYYGNLVDSEAVLEDTELLILILEFERQ